MNIVTRGLSALQRLITRGYARQVIPAGEIRCTFKRAAVPVFTEVAPVLEYARASVENTTISRPAIPEFTRSVTTSFARESMTLIFTETKPCES